MISKSFKKALCLLCAVALIASTLVVMSVSASAAAISSDENLFTSLEQPGESINLSLTNTETKYNLASKDGKGTLGLVSTTGSSDGMHSISRTLPDGTSGFIVKFAKNALLKRGLTFGKDNVAGNGANYAFVLSPDTDYTVTYNVVHESGAGISFDLIATAAVNSADGITLDSNQRETALNSWTSYTRTFKTPNAETMGDNKYLMFAVNNPNGVNNVVWLYNVTITTMVSLDPKDLITFNDNGKTYYAYPDKLTALPEGDNGTLDSEFIAWVDADGNTVTEVPAAGTVLNAKYPVMTEIPDEEESVYLALTNTANKTLAGNDSKGTLGLSSSSGSSHDIYSRKAKLIDGTSTWIVKFAHTSTNAPNNLPYRSICFGKENTTADGSDNAYVLEPNTKYTVTYNILHESGANISFDLAAGTSTKSTNGLVLDSNKPASVISSWMTYTREFTTPDAETMGNQKYLLFVINNPALEVNVSWLYGVTVTKFVAGDPADYISFVDGDKTYYTEVGDTAKLPKGQLAEGEERFLGWYDANGERVLEMPTEAGAVLTARYGVVKDGTVATSFREVSGTGSDYVSAGVRFRARLDTATVEAAEEVGFILVPNGNTVDSPLAIKGIAKNKNTHIIYDLTYDGFYDYQVIVTGLTREGVETNLCDLKIDVYFYYTLNGVTNFVGQPYTTSYNELTAGN